MKKMFFLFVALFVTLNINAQLDFSGIGNTARLLPFMGAYITEVRANGQVMVEIAPGVTYALRANWFPGEGSVPCNCTVAEAINKTLGNRVQRQANRAGIEMPSAADSGLVGYGISAFGTFGALKAAKRTKRADSSATAVVRSRVENINSRRIFVNSGSQKKEISVTKEMHVSDTGKVTVSDIDRDYDF